MQFEAFDSNHLHESEIRGQGNQRFFPSLSSTVRGSLSFAKKNFKRNLWDQSMTLQTKRLLTSRSSDICGEVNCYEPGDDVALKDSEPSL